MWRNSTENTEESNKLQAVIGSLFFLCPLYSGFFCVHSYYIEVGGDTVDEDIQKLIDEEIRMNKRHRRLGKQLNRKVANAIASMEAENISLSQIKDFLKLSTEIEAKALKAELEGRERRRGKEFDFSSVSTEELLEMANYEE